MICRTKIQSKILWFRFKCKKKHSKFKSHENHSSLKSQLHIPVTQLSHLNFTIRTATKWVSELRTSHNKQLNWWCCDWPHRFSSYLSIFATNTHFRIQGLLRVCVTENYSAGRYHKNPEIQNKIPWLATKDWTRAGNWSSRRVFMFWARSAHLIGSSRDCRRIKLPRLVASGTIHLSYLLLNALHPDAALDTMKLDLKTFFTHTWYRKMCKYRELLIVFFQIYLTFLLFPVN